MTPEFQAFPKIPRLFRDIIITEKLDGTNAAIGIGDHPGSIWAQSRKRLITSEDDNFGFARWVEENADKLIEHLGPGLHFGEWWGCGIQRGYGLQDKRFSLFNTDRWADIEKTTDGLVSVVPTLYHGPFAEKAVTASLGLLSEIGSVAARGYANPEGVVVFHVASRHIYKALLENDELPKGLVA